MKGIGTKPLDTKLEAPNFGLRMDVCISAVSKGLQDVLPGLRDALRVAKHAGT